VQIPLDYYRILGVPIQATDDLLTQAYHDRCLQLPPREYSQYAIAARKQLLAQAYEVLNDSTKRSEYNSQFLAASYGELTTVEVAAEIELELELEEDEAADKQLITQVYPPTLELSEDLLIGALLILQELGEYELVLKLARPYLDSQKQLPVLIDNTEQLQAIWGDVILTVVLAYLELGREEWQLQEYELAAQAQEEGYNLLVQEKLFPNLQQEIEAELYKLRPYRILELLEQQNQPTSQRQKGLELLQEMLDERNGIEGKGIDKSGLNLEDFLLFIQQIRVYLNVREQQQLFEGEAKRPSAAAGYLAFYALLARGFAERNPALIVGAKNILISLTARQDVYLEQAICALLLGQTEEAEFALGQSQEQEALDYIREHSQASPDLLPGLCLYAEKWLQTEVFSQFRDLNNQPSSLKEYFADREVQTYLEKFYFPSSQTTDESWPSINYFSDYESFNQDLRENNEEEEEEIESSQNRVPNLLNWNDNGDYFERKQKEYSNGNNDHLILENKNVSDVNVMTLVKSEREYPPSLNDELVTFDSFLNSSKEEVDSDSNFSTPESSLQSSGIFSGVNTDFKLSKLAKNIFFRLASTLFLGLIVALLFYNFIFNKKEEKLILLISQPPGAIPTQSSKNPQTPVPKTLDNQTALELVQDWLGAKEKATGSRYEINEFNKVLAEPLLSRWRSRTQQLQRSNAYRRYEHTLAIESVQTNPQNPNQAIIKARVKEKYQYYQNGVLSPSQSYDDDLIVRYDLIKQNNQWLIKDITVLN
jgi:hypothetical protein